MLAAINVQVGETTGGAPPSVLRFVALLLLVLTNAFFVAAEFALVGSRRSKLEQLAAGGNRVAGLVLTQQDQLDRYIAASQLGITLASLFVGALAEPTFAGLLEPPIAILVSFLIGALPSAAHIVLPLSHAMGFAVAYLIATTLHIVLGEQAPKVFAIRAAEDVALFTARPLHWFNLIFSVVIRLLDWLTSQVLRSVGVQSQAPHHGPPTLEELRMLVQASGKGGILERDEQELLINAFDFGVRAAHQVMVPRNDVATIHDDADVAEFLELFKRTGHTRFPVLGQRGVDDVVGVVSAKDLLVALSDNDASFSSPILPLVRSAFFRPESKKVVDLLEEMRRERVRMAVLIDEYGGMAGIATLEDLVEEIVGELDDELDAGGHQIETIDESTIVIDGMMRIEDANDDLHLAIPEGDYETVAGFILDRLGRLPLVNEQVPCEAVVFTVMHMQGPRIARVQIKRQ
ncbi:MAG: hemolysin family protein [Herpetosiphon sp.]